MRRIHTEFLAPSNSYGVSVFIAIAIFIVALTNESRIKLPKGIAALSVVSYSVYLIHGPLTSLVMDRLAPSLPFTVHATIALLILAILAALMWRFVEVPTQLLARRLTPVRAHHREPASLSAP
jgi:peptidoglycan/LPS O-acetylase OafA/YrhL